jgi:NADH-quinone oxidoreductase subunit M
MGWILGFCAMASLGLPSLAGFWGEFPAILSAYNPLHGDGLPFGGLSVEAFRTYMVVAAIGTVLAAGYLLWLYQRTAFGEPNPEFVSEAHLAHSAGAAANPHEDEHADIHDVNIYEWLAWTPLLLAIVVLGVYPQLLFKVTDPAVTHLLGVFTGK